MGPFNWVQHATWEKNGQVLVLLWSTLETVTQIYQQLTKCHCTGKCPPNITTNFFLPIKVRALPLNFFGKSIYGLVCNHHRNLGVGMRWAIASLTSCMECLTLERERASSWRRVKNKVIRTSNSRLCLVPCMADWLSDVDLTTTVLMWGYSHSYSSTRLWRDACITLLLVGDWFFLSKKVGWTFV